MGRERLREGEERKGGKGGNGGREGKGGSWQNCALIVVGIDAPAYVDKILAKIKGERLWR